MFERRLKIFLGVIIAISLLLLCRVFDVQVIGRSYWTKQAVGLLTRPQLTETTRGRILDRNGVQLAYDTACTDACVDYRAIIQPPETAWVKELAISRLRSRLGTEYSHANAQKKLAMQTDEIKAVQNDINVMWQTLATLNIGKDPTAAADPAAAIALKRKEIVDKLEARRRAIADVNHQREQARAAKSSKWLGWLASSSSDDSAADNSAVIAEQEQPHVVLAALDDEACNFLGKHLDKLPGLSLRASTHRSYPLHTVLAATLGRMSGVTAADLESTKNGDELRQYQRQDTLGREGIEALCEPLLRGSRGRIEKRVSDGSVVNSQDFVPGQDVHLSVDSKLQAQVEQFLQHVEETARDEENGNAVTPITPPGGVSMHAAAVVIDVRTNEVRVLASNPGFDANDLADKYDLLASDKLEEPLRNRATSTECEPGSTVKPLIGLGAITQGIIGPVGTIECTGSLYLPAIGPDGKMHKIKMPRGRCWVVSEFQKQLRELKIDGSHHPFPSSDPHPTGFLTFADALERSCDIYFETLADRLQPAGVDHWYDLFGIGRATGIGIYELPGLRPALWKGRIEDPRMNNCWAGMGEGTTWATPIQMANAAATIARGGIWMRPRLLTQESQDALDKVHMRPEAPSDRVDLHIDPEALRQARIGMINVVDGRASTGPIHHASWLTVAAKTGTADTAPLWEMVKDENGKMVRQKRVAVKRFGAETDTPWYRSTDRNGVGMVHSWYMGYAPAENPQIAFCVLVEYAGAGGGAAAGPVASHILEECEKEGYLHR